MKLSALTFVFTLLSSTSAYCDFKLRVENSPDSSLNGLYVQDLNGVATLGPPFMNITGTFPDPEIITESTLLSTGVIGLPNGMFMLVPSLGVERIMFREIPPAGARYTEWSLLHSLVSSRLTYGTGDDRWVVYSPPSVVAHYEIYWVPQGVMFGGSAVDLVVECV